MGTHRNSKLRSHQQNRQILVHATDAATVDLTEINRTRLHELLEHDAVLAVFTGRDFNRAYCIAYDRVAQYVVGARGFFNPVGIIFRQFKHPANGIVHIPELVGVHHQKIVRTDLFADDCGAAFVLFEIAPDFHLECGPPFRESFLTEPTNLLIRIAQPSD